MPTIRGCSSSSASEALRVIYLTVGSELPDYSDLLPHMRAMAAAVGNTRGRREHEILDELAPRPHEAVLNKTTMSAFHSSGFERLLRAWGVEQLVFTGVSTNSCVEGTARDAADRGFRCLLVEDGCGAASRRLHEAACQNFQRLLGRVESSAAVIAELDAARVARALSRPDPPAARTGGDERMPGKLFEELEPGQVFKHQPGRTITESDNVFFSCLTMNPQPLHVDFHAAQKAEFGKPLVNSLLTLGIAVGLSVGETTLGTTVGNLGFEKVEFPKPVFHGDTIYSETEVVEKRESKSRPQWGIVIFEHRARNQHGDLVMTCRRAAMMRRRSA